jgi:O-antigen biosynthesis protein
LAGVPAISVFTPSHDPRFLGDCYQSLKGQSYPDWEWVVVLNGDAARAPAWPWAPVAPEPARWPEDGRVRVYADSNVSGVGAAKEMACALCTGDILVELDHDDLLAPDALWQVASAFEARPEVVLVYSHCAQVLEDGSRDDSRFEVANGWEYRETRLDGKGSLQYAVSFAPTPHNVCYIWFAPNHLRAFRRSAYEQVGGYDPARYYLDDQDLMCRLYQVGDFRLIDECLYVQRMWAANTQRRQDVNPAIQTGTVELYERYIEPCALAWCQRAGLVALDLGAAHGHPAQYVGVDKQAGDGVDIVAHLGYEPLPCADNSVGVVRAMDFLEHVEDKVTLWDELYRVLVPGGLVLSMTPSTDGRGAFQDPTHCAYYNENSFWYLTEDTYRAYVPDQQARFQVSRLCTHYPSQWHAEHAISYVTANLIALKPAMVRNGGPVRC